jgi:hypothetical protein
MATYIVTNNGLTTGLCASDSSACTMSRALALVTAGDTIEMLDGTYQGAPNMIDLNTVAPGKSGTESQRITVKARNDGKVVIDGQWLRTPLRMESNSYWVFEGFDAKRGVTFQAGNLTIDAPSGATLYIRQSRNNIFRRMVVQDAPIHTNSFPIVNGGGSTDNLFEDFAAFGTGRKIFLMGNGTICRRCWFRAEGSTREGYGPDASVAYNTINTIFENVLVTHSGESMPETYTSTPIGGSGTGTPHTNFESPNTAGVIGTDRIDCTHVNAPQPCPPKQSGVHIRGSMVYVKSTDNLPPAPIGGAPNGEQPLLWIFGLSYVTITDLITVISPSHSRFNDVYGFAFNRTPHNAPTGSSAGGFPVQNNVANRITSLRGSLGDFIHADWTSAGLNSSVTGVSSGSSSASIQTPWQNTSSTGARLCYRWGTTTPLWPWPMNARILAATSAAGSYDGPCMSNCVGGRAARTATNVTTDIEALLGPIPAACRTDAQQPPVFVPEPNFPSTPELDAFGDSGLDGWSVLTGGTFTEGGGVAAPTTAGTFSVIQFDALYTAHQEAWAEIGGLDTEGGVGHFINFYIQSATTRFRYKVSRVSGNDVVSLDRIVNNVSTPLVQPISLGFDVAVGDKFGIRATNDVVSIYFFDASSWTEWRRIAHVQVSGTPDSSKIGLAASSGSFAAFGGGTITTRGPRPTSPSRPTAPSRPVAPGM